MGYISDRIANALVDELFGGIAYSPPGTLYIGLSLQAPGDAGATDTPPTGAYGYARVAKTNNTTNFPTAANRTKTNGTAVTFPTATGGNWGTVTHWTVYESATGGTADFVGWGSLDASQAVNNGTYLTFATGSMVFKSTGTV